MGQDPSQIRQDIEHTRGEMGDTVEALGHKADVPGRAKEAISSRVDTVKDKVPSTGQAAGVAKENPLGLAVGAAAVGFVAGMLIPSTRVEDEKIGPMADQVKEKARETGQEALERGKDVARQTAESAKETAQEAGKEQAGELRDSAQDKAAETQGVGARA
jgi:gas vesicle protein